MSRRVHVDTVCLRGKGQGHCRKRIQGELDNEPCAVHLMRFLSVSQGQIVDLKTSYMELCVISRPSMSPRHVCLGLTHPPTGLMRCCAEEGTKIVNDFGDYPELPVEILTENVIFCQAWALERFGSKHSADAIVCGHGNFLQSRDRLRSRVTASRLSTSNDVDIA